MVFCKKRWLSHLKAMKIFAIFVKKMTNPFMKLLLNNVLSTCEKNDYLTDLVVLRFFEKQTLYSLYNQTEQRF